MDKVKQKLTPIGGFPPSLLNPPLRCPFAPRCAFTIERCWHHMPENEEVEAHHFAACFRSGEQLW
jgi:oligopeptide/dipeptide ABC transporter ATP-binding protein